MQCTCTGTLGQGTYLKHCPAPASSASNPGGHPTCQQRTATTTTDIKIVDHQPPSKVTTAALTTRKPAFSFAPSCALRQLSSLALEILAHVRHEALRDGPPNSSDLVPSLPPRFCLVPRVAHLLLSIIHPFIHPLCHYDKDITCTLLKARLLWCICTRLEQRWHSSYGPVRRAAALANVD